MLVGYVSDERYVAIADVAIEIDRDGETVAVTHSTARGKVLAAIEPGRYRVTLAKPGFGSKSVIIDIDGETPYQFRLRGRVEIGQFVGPQGHARTLLSVDDRVRWRRVVGPAARDAAPARSTHPITCGLLTSRAPIS